MENLTQIRMTSRVIIEEGRQRIGNTLWVTHARARDLIDQKCAEYAGAAPAEKKPLPGPSEKKPVEPTEKKSSGAETDGQSTDLPGSTEAGAAPLSSVVQADRVSPETNSPGSEPTSAPTKQRRVKNSA